MTGDADATLGEIRRIYFATTPATIGRDLERAIALLKTVADETERGKAAVYMEGLLEMQREWGGNSTSTGKPRRRK